MKSPFFTRTICSSGGCNYYYAVNKRNWKEIKRILFRKMWEGWNYDCRTTAELEGTVILSRRYLKSWKYISFLFPYQMYSKWQIIKKECDRRDARAKLKRT